MTQRLENLLKTSLLEELVTESTKNDFDSIASDHLAKAHGHETHTRHHDKQRQDIEANYPAINGARQPMPSHVHKKYNYHNEMSMYHDEAARQHHGLHQTYRKLADIKRDFGVK